MAKSALPLIIGAGAAAVLLSKKKKKSGKGGGAGRWGVQVSSDCRTVDIVNPELFSQFLFGAFNELVETDPSLTLIQMTDALFGDVAPDCSGFPEDPQSAAVAELYAVIARAMGQYMVNDPRVDLTIGGLIDQATQTTFTDWYRAWRNYPSSDVAVVPSSEVSFSSDLSIYEIGPDWYKETVVPFVLVVSDSNRLDMAFEDFVASRGVMVGQFIAPISELPQDVDSVEDFLDKLEEAIDKATEEIVGG